MDSNIKARLERLEQARPPRGPDQAFLTRHLRWWLADEDARGPEPQPPRGNPQVISWNDPIHLPGYPAPDPEPIFEGTDPPIIPLTDDRYRQPGGDTDGEDSEDRA